MRITSLVENTVGNSACGAAHGLCLHIETPKHRLLMDTGPSDLLVRNAEALQIPLQSVDTVVISHGHYDHADGLAAFSAINPFAPVYIRQGASDAFYSVSGGPARYIGMNPASIRLPQLRWLSGDLHIDESLFLFGGVSGRRAWPEGNRDLLREIDGQRTQDSFEHEQSLVVEDGGRRVLLSGCAHCGILNILDRFHALLGGWPDAIISGFHMKQPAPHTDRQIQTIETTARLLLELPSMFYTGHCTGLPAYEIMKSIMGPRLQYLHCGDGITI